MLKYNFDRVFKARGIDKPFTYMCKNGISDNLASKVNNNKVARMNLSSIERLCILLKCTPNDFMEWTPENDTNIGAEHPINLIRKPEKEVNLTKTINSIPLGRLSEIEEMIKAKLNDQ